MPEYVYAIHDFRPENEDEIAFRAGDPIEVIEKDDQYSDGWWQGRNLEGKIGLFPGNYTTPAEPTSTQFDSSLRPLQEDVERTSLSGVDSESNIGLAIGGPSSVEGEVMKATMTDVQKAIEQLGSSDNDRDGAGSFSFASTRDGDTDDVETDGEIGVANGGDGWHRNARDRLALEARKVVEEKAAADAALRSAPPIEVEMSDESEGEDDEGALQHLQNMHFTHNHPHIPEEDEEEISRGGLHRGRKRNDSADTSSAILPPEDVPIPKRDSTSLRKSLEKVAARVSSPLPRSPPPDRQRSPPLLPTPTSTNAQGAEGLRPPSANLVPLPVSPTPSAQVTYTSNSARDGCEVLDGLPSPALTAGSSQRNSAQLLKHNLALSTTKSSTATLQSPRQDMETEKKSAPPSEWSVEEVVEWLKSKGFSQDVCDKFIEQEITGDVLLELDINLLKTEIGIVAFGKRMRIANAIAELHRPPVTPGHENQVASSTPSLPHPQLTPPISQSYLYSHSRTASITNSLNSPSFATSMGAAQAAIPPSSVLLGVGPPGSPNPDITASPMTPNRMSSLSSTGASLINASPRASVRGSVEGNGIAAGIGKATLLGTTGLGFNLRPGQLSLSPSDPSLNKHDEETVEGPGAPTDEDDRGALSDGEVPRSSSRQRRRFFGRSTESSVSAKDKASSSNNSKDGTSSGTASPRPKRTSSDDTSVLSRQSRAKRGVEVALKGTERLSLFGATFPASLGKSRKPPPRVTSTILDENGSTEKGDKPSSLGLSRLYRKSAGRPSTSDGRLSSDDPFRRDRVSPDKTKFPSLTGETQSERDRGSKDSSTLIKRPRTLSTAGAAKPSTRVPTTLTPGKSVIEQIGEADHTGWMRKKGDHYNSWKLRYFIIKGPHLYILRTSSKTETKIKGYINVSGYKVVADENIDPGRYGFRIIHDTDKTHAFSSDEQLVVREWMKAIMKATIGRDYTKPVVSSVNIPTIPLTVAQAMNPAPRPPSPTARDAMQKALRRENPNQLSTRDARVLMGLPSVDSTQVEDSQANDKPRLDQIVSAINDTSESGSTLSTPRGSKLAPPRPSREGRRTSTQVNDGSVIDNNLISWANSHLPQSLQVVDPTGSLFGGLAILRLAESVVGKTTSPPITDSAFPSGPGDDKLEGLFRLFDFLLDNDVRVENVSINDVRQGKRDKVVQLLKALKSWEDRRRDILRSMGQGSAQGSTFMTLRR
ncbi:hypothetical protein EDD16DRAFT_1751122 [Pisolithus croceorrhizus]|nr:hypothetical protein EDD16DRAFT_1751122 [Pisolithus croceorrhizus]KAI6135570.1 hypothetical protein EV401DRAFT_2094136 [Pisolithus croceorrhizus]